MARLDRILLGEQHCPLEHVLELADVPRPLIAEQHVHRFRGEPRNGAPLHGAADGADELLGQRRDLALPLPERRDHQREAVEPIVEIAAERAALDLLLQIAVGGGHEARSEEHTSELQSQSNLVCRLLLEKKKKKKKKKIE